MLAERGDKEGLGMSQELVDQKLEQLNIIKNLKAKRLHSPQKETQYTIFASVDKEYNFYHRVNTEAS